MARPGGASEGREPADWSAVLRGDRDAFQAVVASYVPELLKAAQRELRYHIELGDIDVHDLTAAEIVGEALSRAWRDRSRRPDAVSVRAWLLAEVLKTAGEVIRREARQKAELTTTTLDDPVPPEPIHSYEEPFELAPREEVLNVLAPTPEDEAAADERRAHQLPARLRHVFVMHELHHVPMGEIAVLMRISEQEIAARLASGREHASA